MTHTKIGFPKFAVIGAGNVGRAMAAHLSLMGYEVNLYNRSEEKIASLIRIGKIKIFGAITGFGEPNLITSNIEMAIADVNVIMVTIPASGHKDIAEAIAPYLKDGQIVILNPGRTFGSLEFNKTLKNLNGSADITVSETQTIIYTTRYYEKEVEVFALKNRVSLAAFPAYKTKNVIHVLDGVYPQLVPEINILKTGLDNVGAILHPTPTLLNVGWIESPKTAFKYYYEAITPTLAGFLETMDSERISVAEALGIKAISTKDWLYETYGAKGNNLYEALQNNESYRTIDAPTTIQHRYIFEDVPTGLVPIASLGNMLGIPTPTINLVIDLAVKLTGIDFRKTGRTVENLGLKGLSAEGIINLVENGEL